LLRLRNKHEWNGTDEMARLRGGQPGNKNAAGNKGGGAPLGNRNAVKHGGYARITLDSLSEDEKEFLEDCDTTNDEETMLEHEIKLLTIRISRLMKQISADKYAKGLYVDYVEISETKRRFKAPEDEAEYYRLVQEEIDRGDRNPGEPYKVHTIKRNSDEFILSIHEVITRAQALRQRCLESLIRLRMAKRANTSAVDIEDLQDLREAVFSVHKTQDQDPDDAGKIVDNAFICECPERLADGEQK